MSHNKATLEEFQKNYTNESATTDIIFKKMKDLDIFASKAISIGTAMYFRDLMREGLSMAVEEKVPYIFNTVKTCFHQYKHNTFINPNLLSSDCLAYDCGLPLVTADHAFKRFLQKAIGTAEAPLWDLIPYMFAASFYSLPFRETSFRASLEGHSNNAHAMMKCINELLVGFKSIVSQTNDEQEIVDSLKSFLDISSVLLLRLPSTVLKEKFTPQHFSSIIICMDKVTKLLFFLNK